MESGAVTLIDFMLPRGPSSDLIRIVRAMGEVTMHGPACASLRRDHAPGELAEGRPLRAIAGPDMVLRTPPSSAARISRRWRSSP
jgi:hypothetical protein